MLSLGNFSAKQPLFICFSAPFPEKGQTAPVSGCGKFSSGDGKRIQIRAGEHGVQSVLVFLQTTIHGFPVAELTLDDPAAVSSFRASRFWAECSHLPVFGQAEYLRCAV